MGEEKAIEEWRSAGHKDLIGRYEVSNYGRVKALGKRPGILKPGIHYACGHHFYSLTGTGRKKLTFLAARLVLLTFVGSPPQPNFEASHLDGNSQNDYVDNLAWESHTDNVRRLRQHGTQPYGEKVVTARLTDAMVEEFRHRFHINGEPIRLFARETGISTTTIHMAVHGQSWTHLSMPPVIRAPRKMAGPKKKSRECNA